MWAVHNGELYGPLALRSELEGHRFASRCDTEVIPHLYEQFGDRFPERLRGMDSACPEGNPLISRRL